MGKPKIIDDNTLIKLIDKYYYEESLGQISCLKTHRIVSYVQRNGYPKFQDYTLRRSEDAMKHIEELKKRKTEDVSDLIAYKTLDVQKFVEDNQSKEKLIAEITSLDGYYKRISESALEVFKKFREYENKIIRLERELQQERIKNEKLQKKNEELHASNKEQEKAKKEYKNVVDKYIYPEIANKLLKEVGINAGTVEHIVKEPEIVRGDNLIDFRKSLLKAFEENKNEG